MQVEAHVSRFRIFEKLNENYIPGSCNIGKEEVKRRYRIGYVGLVCAILLAIIFALTQAHPYWKFILIIPVFYSLSGFIQAWKKFCYIYGIKGVFSVKGRKTFAAVKDPVFLKQDRRLVIQLVSLITLCSLVITLAYYYLSA